MKPSEIFEGENSGLRKAFDEAVGREQSPTDKILAEFRDIFLKDESSLGLSYLMTNGAIKKFELEKIEAFLTTKIDQTLAEERAKMRCNLPEIKVSILSSLLNDCPNCGQVVNRSFVDDLTCRIQDEYKQKILSFLKKPLTDN